MIRHSRFHQVDSVIIYGLAVISVLVLSNIEKPITHLWSKKTVQVKEVATLSIFNQEAFSNIKIKGKAYVVYDIVDRKIIAQKNASEVLPLASITKVMTAITARTHYDKNKSITINSRSVEGGYDLGLRKGQVFDLDELLKYTLIFSSNDGAQAIADGLGGRNFFVSQMNIDAKQLGLDLVFTHPAGIDEGNNVGGKGSAYTVAKLTAVARRQLPEIFDVTTKRRATVVANTGKITGVPNTNQNVNNFLGLEISKTGFTDMAGGNLAIVVDILVGHPVAIVVLGSTHEGRFSDMEILYEALQKSLIR